MASQGAHLSSSGCSVGLIDSENSRRPFVGSESGFAHRKVAPRKVLPEYAGASEDSAVVSFGDSGRFASGMAARKGEDPLAGLQRSLQPGPQGDAHLLRTQRRTTANLFRRPLVEHPQSLWSPVFKF
ncbi:hypothetical protein DXU07_46295 [Bradyrhizobium elkanii]|jgi:hypothetical protein|nr:hypothetical protein [Bradyrhizobium elkanii]NWL74756.1 hypothetical protein [Bradyrhizobium elkanii]